MKEDKLKFHNLSVHELKKVLRVNSQYLSDFLWSFEVKILKKPWKFDYFIL